MVLVALDGVVNKLLDTVGTSLSVLEELRRGTLGQQFPHRTGSTLGLTVHTLLGTHTLVTFLGLPTEVIATKLHT